MRNKVQSILTKVNKPSKYIGQEVGSFNKNWESAEVRTALAFPDLYEIGISNLGLRILYDKINNYPKKNFLADRVYAPDADFKNELLKNNIPLYAVESFKSLADFDLIAFSLQYELSYPTILAMFDMANIPLKSVDRKNNHPVILAGGPGSYNPETISEFIDVFILGDGESVIIEILEEISSAKNQNLSREKTLKNLSSIEGVYVPSLHDNKTVINKRIDNIDNKDYPVNFPVPYSTAVHDRAVVEIRRGCGRMCRFCQPGFVNLPVRERSPENIIYLVDEVLKNTGYDEYSLLSLSSNDYKNIEGLVKTLNAKHACKGVSISLPSQRADKFSLELAQQVQSVRKSTITLAPEAGSQRLRNVINKNLTEKQITDAVMSVYKAGWHSVKLYFMIGLPTETYDDLDAIIELLQTLKNKSRDLKNQLGLKKFLSITCTVSIFVPKPFTPFQWYAQDKLQVMEEKINYLKQKARPIRDVKLNYHDGFLSQLEAVFSRGDKSLNKLIEEVYKNGSYLDAWHEHFNKDIWRKTAESLKINFEDYACKEFQLDDELVWDIFNAGVEKSFLIEEYKKAYNYCESPRHSEQSEESIQQTTKEFIPRDVSDMPKYTGEIYRYRMKIQKLNDLKYISHLDWQKLIYSAIRKAGLKINFTQGFNPTPKLSLALALPIFMEGKAEYADIELQENLSTDEIKEKLNKFLPEYSKILEIVKISKQNLSVDKEVCWAKYTAIPVDEKKVEKNFLKSIVKNTLLEENIVIDKDSKKGLKKINIRPSIYSLEVDEKNGQCKLEFILKTGQGTDNNISALRADKFLNYLIPEVEWKIVREVLLNSELKVL